MSLKFTQEYFMTSLKSVLLILSALAALVLSGTSLSAMAQAKAETATPAKSAASEPGAYEKTKAATRKAAKATAKAGGDVADATKKVAGKAGAAVTSAGNAIDSKIPRTEAYKKQHANDKPKDKANPQSGQATN